MSADDAESRSSILPRDVVCLVSRTLLRVVLAPARSQKVLFVVTFVCVSSVPLLAITLTDDRVAGTKIEPTSTPVVSDGHDAFVVEAHSTGSELGTILWYVNGTYRASEALSGRWDRTSLPMAIEPGSHIVTARVLDDAGRVRDTVRWAVAVTEQQPIPPQQNRSLYVWEPADEIVTDPDVRQRFFERTERLNVSTVYFSWGAIQHVPRASLADFLMHASDRNMTIMALIGLRGQTSFTGLDDTVRPVLAYNDGRPAAAQFDGIHLDIEPANRDTVKPFLTNYASALDNVSSDWTADGATFNSQELSLVLSVGPWWAERAPTRTKTLLERDSIDRITIMAYNDRAAEVSRRTETVTALDTGRPYEVAVETDEISPEQVTFYEEGLTNATCALETVARRQATSAFRGGALHAYGQSVTRWDSLQNVDATTVANGSEVAVESTVAFDGPAERQNHSLQVTVLGSNTSTKRTVSLDSIGSQSTETVVVTVPTPPSTDRYVTTVTVVDTTKPTGDIENDPVELDTAVDVSNVTVQSR